MTKSKKALMAERRTGGFTRRQWCNYPGIEPFSPPGLKSSLHAQDQSQDQNTVKEKHACKGQNSCKGRGGCKASDNGCKVQELLQGQGWLRYGRLQASGRHRSNP